MVSAHQHREHLLVGRGTRPLSTDVQEHWPAIFVKELIILPVSLLVGPLVVLGKVVNLVVVVVGGVLVH